MVNTIVKQVSMLSGVRSGMPLCDCMANAVHDYALSALSQAFFGIEKDPQGIKILAIVSDIVKLPAVASFMPSNDSGYDAYRQFYRTAPTMQGAEGEYLRRGMWHVDYPSRYWLACLMRY